MITQQGRTVNEKGRSARRQNIKTRFNTQSVGVRRHFYRPLTFYVALLFDTYQSPPPLSTTITHSTSLFARYSYLQTANNRIEFNYRLLKGNANFTLSCVVHRSLLVLSFFAPRGNSSLWKGGGWMDGWVAVLGNAHVSCDLLFVLS